MIIHVLNRFDAFELAPGEDGSALLEKAKDHFTVGLQPLSLVFKQK